MRIRPFKFKQWHCSFSSPSLPSFCRTLASHLLSIPPGLASVFPKPTRPEHLLLIIHIPHTWTTCWASPGTRKALRLELQALQAAPKSTSRHHQPIPNLCTSKWASARPALRRRPYLPLLWPLSHTATTTPALDPPSPRPRLLPLRHPRRTQMISLVR